MRGRVWAFASKWRWWIGASAVLAGLGLWARWDFAVLQQRHENARDGLPSGVPYQDVLDLHAQQTMAEFAYGVLLFGAFGFAVSVVGTVALILTLRESRIMVEATRENTQLELRAYIFPKAATAQLREGGARLVVTLEVTHRGPTPATNLRAVGSMFRLDQLDPKVMEARGTLTPIVDDPGGKVELSVGREALQAWFGKDDDAQFYIPRAAKFALFGSVVYQDVFGAERHTSFNVIGDVPEDDVNPRKLQVIPGMVAAFAPVPTEGVIVRPARQT